MILPARGAWYRAWPESDRTDLVRNKKVAAIAEILKMRDQLVVMRERLFQLTAATAARTKKVDGLLIDCAGAGRVFGVRTGLPDWNNVLAMPGHQSPSSKYPKEDLESKC